MSVTSTKTATKKKRRFRWRRALVLYVLLPFAGLFCLLKWGIAPLVIRKGLEAAVAARTRGHIEVRSASVGWRSVELKGVSLADATGRVLGSAELVEIRLDRPPVGFGRPGIETLRLVRPDITLTLEADGQFDLQRVLSPPPGPAAPPANAAPTVSTPPPAPTLSPLLPETVSVENGTLRLVTSCFSPTFTSLDAVVAVEPRRFALDRAVARAEGGRASLSGWIGRGGMEGWKLQANIEAADVRDAIRGTGIEKTGITGRLDAFLSIERGLTGAPVGAGWLDIHDGRLLELPVLLSVFNLLRANSPGETVVHTCRTDFRVLPDRVHIDRGWVLTDGVCLFGDGDILFDGQKLDLDFIPRLTGEPPDGYETLEDAEEPVADFVRKNFLVNVEVSGTWLAPEAETTPLRVIAQPLKDFFSLLKGKRKK